MMNGVCNEFNEQKQKIHMKNTIVHDGKLIDCKFEIQLLFVSFKIKRNSS